MIPFKMSPSEICVLIVSFTITTALLVYGNNRQAEVMDLADNCAEQWNVEEEGLTERNMDGYFYCLGDDRELSLNSMGYPYE